MYVRDMASLCIRQSTCHVVLIYVHILPSVIVVIPGIPVILNQVIAS